MKTAVVLCICVLLTTIRISAGSTDCNSDKDSRPLDKPICMVFEFPAVTRRICIPVVLGFLLFLCVGVVTGDAGDDGDSNNAVDDEHKACKDSCFEQGYICKEVNGGWRCLPNVIVKTSAGKIRGQREKIKFDGNWYIVNTFLGVPYAEPPVGEYRFRKPVSKANFKQTYNASSYGPACLQQNTWIKELSEDCLTLNIFAPELFDMRDSECKLPVMIYLHGGGFMRDTAALYQGQHLSAFGRVIVVTMNYRLGHMGFLRTDETYGNFGLWDQREAIVWVNNNIEAFGGNASEITVFGGSAGSSAVLYQALYPGNVNLFQRVIAQSGGITSPWAFTTAAHANAIFQNFTGEIGCIFDDHEKVMECLRNKSSEEIAELITSPSSTLSFDRVVPNLDNEFVPLHPRKMLEASSATKASMNAFHKLDFMMGSCSIDGALSLPAYMAALNISEVNNFKVPRDVYEETFIPNILATTYTDMETVPEIATDATIYKYTYWANVTDDIERSKQLIDLSSDTALFVPMVNTSRLHVQGTQRSTYVYLFSTVPFFRLFPLPDWLISPTNTNHAEDGLFVFGFSIKLIPAFSWFPVTDKDIAASKNVMSMWSNYAKTGNPNTPYSLPVQWPAFDLVSENYLDITERITAESVKVNFEADRMAFWADFLPDLFKNGQ